MAASFSRSTKGHTRFCCLCGHVIGPEDLRVSDCNTHSHPFCYARAEGILPMSLKGWSTLSAEEKEAQSAGHKALPNALLRGTPAEVAAEKLAIKSAWKAAHAPPPAPAAKKGKKVPAVRPHSSPPAPRPAPSLLVTPFPLAAPRRS